MSQQQVEDITLVLQLQNKMRELEKERRTLARKVEHLESSASPTDDPQHAQELIRVGGDRDLCVSSISVSLVEISIEYDRENSYYEPICVQCYCT